jgi:hypothetical protein
MGQHLFRSVKSVHIRHFPFFFQTITTFANHWGYATSLMKPTSSSHRTLAIATSIFSSDILKSFCFLGFALRLTCNLCSIISLLTPMRLEVDHTKISLFLLRNAKSSAYFSRLVLLPRQTALSGTLGSIPTFLKSPSASMAFLNSAIASLLTGHSTC